MGKLSLILVMMAMSPAVFAQSADNFAAKVTPPVPPEGKADQPVKKVAKVAGPVSTTPSRFIGSKEREPYLESLSSMFLINSRELDAFGQPQDPDAKPMIRSSSPKTTKRAVAIQATPFSDIVGMLVVTTIMPGERKFLLGTRSVKEGDQLALSLRGKQIQVLVTSVTSEEIGFRNLETGETAARKLDMIPPGMRRGHDGIIAPGMVPDRPNAPIELEGAEPAPESLPKLPNDP